MNPFIFQLIQGFFSIYTVLIFIRIALSWFPSLYKYKVTNYVIYLTDPYMNIFKRLIPPIGGVLDLSPMLALFSLRILQTFFLTMLR